MTDPGTRPWQRLDALAEAGEVDELERFLSALSPGEIARVFANLDRDARQRVLMLLDPAEAASAIDEMPDAQAAALVERLPSVDAAAIVSELPSAGQADLLSELDDEVAEAILEQMEPAQAQIARALASHEPDTAGGLMIAEYLSFPEDDSVAPVVADLRSNAERYADFDVQYVYTTDRARRLVGVLSLRNLLMARSNTPLRSLAVAAPSRVSAGASLDELREVFQRQDYLGIPVVTDDDELVGVVRRADVQEALEDRSESDHLKSQGIVGGEELRTMPLLRRSLRRLSWLSVNIVLNLIAASVIALYQDTLQAVIALAVFLPIISDMSGCSGNQAVAVSMRELTLGLIRPVDAARVWAKEVSVGLPNGVVLGLLVAGAAWLWQGNAYLGLVVGAAMAVNTVVAVSLGGVIPLTLRGLHVDPALASGPVLTTVTDMCGFLLLLGLATAFLPALIAG